jgi:U4/U6.U5 tri-snRNP-associated protein 2
MEHRVCPYLDTINRLVLDFDFEKICSISLANMNVYACLVCGKYFQGRGENTHAYFHSLQEDHHVFINLHTSSIYCRPENYDVHDVSLQDIKNNLRPRFSRQMLPLLSVNKERSAALDGTPFLPGTVGMNNIKFTDWFNSCMQMLVCVPPLRNFFLIEDNYRETKSSLVREFGHLVCKLWHARNFKAHISPHELLQAIAVASNKKFRIGHQSDPIKFMAWFLNTLHKDLGGNSRKSSSIISRTFQGEIEITQEKDIRVPTGYEDEDEEVKVDVFKRRIKFLYLSLGLPAMPLFSENQQFEQIPLFQLLSKFDGETITTMADGTRKTHRITQLPDFMILHYQRFKNNQWFMEKNHTLVNFPLKNLDMKPYLAEADYPSVDALEAMSVKELKRMCGQHKLDISGATEKSDLVDTLSEYFEEREIPCRMDLIANICHEGKPETGTYRVHTYHQTTNTWYELEDIHVWTSETMGQLVALSETYVQCFALQNR